MITKDIAHAWRLWTENYTDATYGIGLIRGPLAAIERGDVLCITKADYDALRAAAGANLTPHSGDA